MKIKDYQPNREYKADYVEFLFPGFFVIESEARRVGSRDVKGLKIPDECFGFLFFERTEHITNSGELIAGAPKNYSGVYYPGGKVMSLDDVKRQVSDPKTLIYNMRNKNYQSVVKTRKGNFQPFRLEDRVI
ncbi:hypothetical protein JXB28_04985 [Candidatus Woesearchaeota archaeon]|nr:hypothetical protein [Candidatus Woesearchaeota archaeon]